MNSIDLNLQIWTPLSYSKALAHFFPKEANELMEKWKKEGAFHLENVKELIESEYCNLLLPALRQSGVLTQEGDRFIEAATEIYTFRD